MINSIDPQTEVQLCVIHQIRNSIKYVASKHHKAFMADLKPVYRAVSKEAAETALDELEAKWCQQYPVAIQSWRRKWENLSAYFRYPVNIRKVNHPGFPGEFLVRELIFCQKIISKL